MLDNLSYQESGQLMIASLALVLCVGLAAVPMVVIQIMKIQISGFCHEWTSTNCPVRAVTSFLFAVTFVED